MTPVIDLSADNGNFVVNFSYRSKSGDTKVYVVGQTEGASQGFGGYLPCTEEWKSVSVSFEGNGAAKTALQFFGDAPVFIDDIEVCQTGGSVVEPEPISAPVRFLPVTSLQPDLLLIGSPFRVLRPICSMCFIL